MPQKKQEIKFEDAVKRLEEISGVLSKGDVDLDVAVSLYEEAVKLTDICNKKIDGVERRVTVIKENATSESNENE